MKPLFGVAVFGLLPVPPMPACDARAGSPRRPPDGCRGLETIPARAARQPQRARRARTRPRQGWRRSIHPGTGGAVDDLASRMPPISIAPAPGEPAMRTIASAPIVLSILAALSVAANASIEATTRQIGGTVHTVVGDNPIGPTRPAKDGDGHPKNQPTVPHETAVAMATRHHPVIDGRRHPRCLHPSHKEELP